MSSKSFIAGQIFGYWPEWQQCSGEPESDLLLNIFSGYRPSELYVTPFYEGLKNEILSSGFINIKE